MPGGRPPKPVELKRKLGNPGKRPLPTPVTILPAVSPGELGDGPVAELLRTSGAAAWIGPTDLPLVHHTERLLSDIETIRSVLDEGLRAEAVTLFVALNKEFRSCLSLLGLSPTDRGRLGVAEVKARSKLEEMLDRRGRRDGTPKSQSEPSRRATGTTS